MKSRGDWILIVIAMALLCLTGWTGYAQKESPRPKRAVWEYKVENGLSEEQINQLGSEGWELVAVSSTNNQSYEFFKRPK